MNTPATERITEEPSSKLDSLALDGLSFPTNGNFSRNSKVSFADYERKDLINLPLINALEMTFIESGIFPADEGRFLFDAHRLCLDIDDKGEELAKSISSTHFIPFLESLLEIASDGQTKLREILDQDTSASQILNSDVIKVLHRDELRLGSLVHALSKTISDGTATYFEVIDALEMYSSIESLADLGKISTPRHNVFPKIFNGMLTRFPYYTATFSVNEELPSRIIGDWAMGVQAVSTRPLDEATAVDTQQMLTDHQRMPLHDLGHCSSSWEVSQFVEMGIIATVRKKTYIAFDLVRVTEELDKLSPRHRAAADSFLVGILHDRHHELFGLSNNQLTDLLATGLNQLAAKELQPIKTLKGKRYNNFLHSFSVECEQKGIESTPPNRSELNTVWRLMIGCLRRGLS